MSSPRGPGSEKPERICDRVRAVRTLRYGERGRSAFARDLGIPVGSLLHYETDRTPPAQLLVAIGNVAGVRLEWLLTGEGERDRSPTSADSPAAGLAHRLQVLLDRHPELESYARDFLNLLEFRSHQVGDPALAAPPSGERSGLIPLVGSTAAGPAHFWSQLEITDGGPALDARLEERIADYVAQASQRSSLTSLASGPDTIDRTVSLVQYSRPDDDGFLEFLAAPQLKGRYPDAVAWRIDGDSMSPRFLDRDLVITSPAIRAIDQQPCVARQAGQIGVSCKVYRTEEDDVLLIPINERYPPQRIPKTELQWAFRVLASVRLP